jgi:Holin of 3TMs, for gene-transfer release
MIGTLMNTPSNAKLRQTPDRWIKRARPTFLYVIYAVILWAIPLGLLAVINPPRANAVARVMTTYLSGLPDGLLALFGTAYLGYTAARQWGKIAGTDK